MIRPMLALSCAAALLTSCQRSEEHLQSKAEASAPSRAVPPISAALGLTELQLLNADLYGRGKVKLGEVEDLRKNPEGQVTGLIVEIEDSDPDRYILLPIEGLVSTGQGRHINLRADLSQEAFLALPETELPPPPFRNDT